MAPPAVLTRLDYERSIAGAAQILRRQGDTLAGLLGGGARTS